MATILQPGFNDGQALSNCRVGGFQILCNDILPSARRLAKWYQRFTLAFGAAAIAVPIALYFLYYLLPKSLTRRTAPVTTKGTKEAKATKKRDSRLVSGAPRKSHSRNSRSVAARWAGGFCVLLSDRLTMQ